MSIFSKSPSILKILKGKFLGAGKLDIKCWKNTSRLTKLPKRSLSVPQFLLYRFHNFLIIIIFIKNFVITKIKKYKRHNFSKSSRVINWIFWIESQFSSKLTPKKRNHTSPDPGCQLTTQLISFVLYFA